MLQQEDAADNADANQDEAEQEEPAADDADAGRDTANNNTNDAVEPSLLSVAVRFFVTFWTSLIPAQPAPVNVN